ncbi:unnamed protein product, partial [marine sediment metagenome]
MSEDHNYEGEETAARSKRKKNDLGAAIVGVLAFILSLSVNVLLKQAVTGFFEKIRAVLGDVGAWGLALVVGAGLFTLVKIIIFFRACSYDSPFSLWTKLKVTILHYLRFLFAYPVFLFSVILVSVANCAILWLVARSYNINLNVWIYGVTSAALVTVVIFVYHLSTTISKNYQKDLGSVILNVVYRGLKAKAPDSV